MILEIRLFGLVWELLVVKGLLFGFTLPDGHCRTVGLNGGPLCLCVYRDEPNPICPHCGRTLRWGLHGLLFEVIVLCKRKPPATISPA